MNNQNNNTFESADFDFNIEEVEAVIAPSTGGFEFPGNVNGNANVGNGNAAIKATSIVTICFCN
jgi:hypothetical protein